MLVKKSFHVSGGFFCGDNYICRMKYYFYIFYRYYNSQRWEHVPFLQTALVSATVIIMNFFTLALISGIPKYIFANYSDTNLLPLIYPLGYVLMVALFYTLVKEKDMAKPAYQKRYKSRHGWFMILYIIISIAALLTVGMSEYNPNYKKNQYPPDEIIFKSVPNP